MDADTMGRIKGYVRHEEILDFIKQKYDENAISSVEKKDVFPISELELPYKINKHSEDSQNWYSIYGYIYFEYKGEGRALFYSYHNVNFLENLEYYSRLDLKEMAEAEVTCISLGYRGNSVEIIKEIVAHFGGGWVDENNCDDEPYCPINADSDENFKPVRYITMREIRAVFGDNVIIV